MELREYNNSNLIRTIFITTDSLSDSSTDLLTSATIIWSKPKVIFSIKNDYVLILNSNENKEINIKINEIGSRYESTMYTKRARCALKSYMINDIKVEDNAIVINAR